jgi:hypothetical protein
VNSLLDLQARLRDDAPEPPIGDTLVDSPPAMMSEQAANPEQSDTVSVIEADVEVVMGSPPRAEAPSLEGPAPPVPDLAGFSSSAPSVAVPAPPATVPQTREEQIADLAKRIDHLELEVSFVAEELWRIASNPPPPPERSF